MIHLPGHFGILKMRKVIANKCYWEKLRHDAESSVKGDVYLVSKAVRHKPYIDLQCCQ